MKLRHYTIVMILIMGCLLIATGILAGHSNFGASNGRIFVGMLLVVIGLVLAVLFRRKARHETAVFHSTTAGSAGPRADSASVRPEYTLSVADKSMAESLVKTCACIGRKGGFSPVPVDLAKNDAARMGRVLGDNGGYPRMQAVFDSYRDRGGDPRLLVATYRSLGRTSPCPSHRCRFPVGDSVCGRYREVGKGEKYRRVDSRIKVQKRPRRPSGCGRCFGNN